MFERFNGKTANDIQGELKLLDAEIARVNGELAEHRRLKDAAAADENFETTAAWVERENALNVKYNTLTLRRAPIEKALEAAQGAEERTAWERERDDVEKLVAASAAENPQYIKAANTIAGILQRRSAANARASDISARSRSGRFPGLTPVQTVEERSQLDPRGFTELANAVRLPHPQAYGNAYRTPDGTETLPIWPPARPT